MEKWTASLGPAADWIAVGVFALLVIFAAIIGMGKLLRPPQENGSPQIDV